MRPNDLARLRAALVQASRWQAQGHATSIADIGCGRCDELSLLVALFPQAALTLIDIDRAAISYLKRLCGGAASRARPVLADARQLDRVAPGPYDLIIIRHPDLDARPDVWDAAISVAAGQLGDGGVLIVSTYAIAEAEAARLIMRRLHLAELPVQPQFEVPVALTGQDRYILMYSRS